MIQTILVLFAVLMLTLGGFGGYEKLRADREEARAQTAEANLKLASQAAQELTQQWAAQIAASAQTLKRQKDADDAQFAKLKARANALARRLVVVSADLDRVLRDAARQANAAAAPATSAKPAVAVPQSAPSVAYSERDLGAFVTKAAEAYADVYRKWHACVSTYNEMRHQ